MAGIREESFLFVIFDMIFKLKCMQFYKQLLELEHVTHTSYLTFFHEHYTYTSVQYVM